MNTKVLWKLYDNVGYDSEYKTERKRDGVMLGNAVRQVFNPAPEIIDIDVSLITKGLKITSESGDCEAIQEINSWDSIIDKFVLYSLIDGKSFMEIVRKEQKEVFLIPLGIDEVTKVEYDEGGNIISAELEYQNGETSIKKTYTMKNIVVKIGDEETSIPNTWEFIPLVEYVGHKGKNDQAVSRIRGLPDILDEINKITANIKSFIDLHADPIFWGDVNIDVEGNSEKELEREEANDIGGKNIRFLPVPDGGKLDILEMRGNIAKLAKDERDTLMEEMRNKFPETLLSKIAAGSGLSGYAVLLKLSGLLSVIEKFRTSLDASLRSVMKIALEMAGFDSEQKFLVHFEDALPTNVVEAVSIIIQAYGAGLIPIELAAKRIAKLMKLDVELVWELLSKEQALLNQFDTADGILQDNNKNFQSYNQEGMKPAVSDAVNDIKNKE